MIKQILLWNFGSLNYVENTSSPLGDCVIIHYLSP